MLVGWCERVLKLPNLTKLCSNASKQMGICAMMHNGFITFLKSHFPSTLFGSYYTTKITKAFLSQLPLQVLLGINRDNIDLFFLCLNVICSDFMPIKSVKLEFFSKFTRNPEQKKYLSYKYFDLVLLITKKPEYI